MPPAIALRNVDEFIGSCQPVDEIESQVLRMSRPDERVAPPIDPIASRTHVTLHLDYTKPLVLSIHHLVAAMSPITVPMKAGGTEFDALDCHLDLLALRNIEQVQFICI